MAQQLLQVQNMSASHRQVSCPRVRLGWGVCGSTKGVGRGEVRLGNSIYSEHDSKGILVTYRVCEDEPTRICDRTVCYGENVEWRKPIGGSNSAL